MEKEKTKEIEQLREELALKEMESLSEDIVKSVSDILDNSGLNLPKCLTATGMAFEQLLLASIDMMGMDAETGGTALDIMFGKIKEQVVEYIKNKRDEDNK